jgi:hypothetical protein
MAGLVAAIHVFFAARRYDVDARHKAWHDESPVKAPNFTGCNCPPKKEDVVGRLMLSA